MHQAKVNAFFVQGGTRLMDRGLKLNALHRDGHEVPVDICLSLIETGDQPLAVVAVRDMTMAMNLSRKQLKDPKLVGYIRQALHRNNLDPQSLVLEVTESLIMEDLQSAQHLLGELKAMGLSLHMDDFGTGY